LVMIFFTMEEKMFKMKYSSKKKMKSRMKIFKKFKTLRFKIMSQVNRIWKVLDLAWKIWKISFINSNNLKKAKRTQKWWTIVFFINKIRVMIRSKKYIINKRKDSLSRDWSLNHLKASISCPNRDLVNYFI